MCVQIIYHKNPYSIGIGRYCIFNMNCKIFFFAGITDCRLNNSSSRNFKIRN